MAVIEHVLSRLNDIGVTDVFGVPGDFALPVNDAVCSHPEMQWNGCCDELKAAYATDEYARIKVDGCFCATYGVGGTERRCPEISLISERLTRSAPNKSLFFN
jgi:indolepyruvate decarboxylase